MTDPNNPYGGNTPGGQSGPSYGSGGFPAGGYGAPDSGQSAGATSGGYPTPGAGNPADSAYGGAYPTGGSGGYPAAGGYQSGGYPGGQMPGAGAPGAAPDNYLVWAILTTIFCCLPLGIVSIIKSSNVNSKWAQGDYAGAQADSADAKKFAMWGAIAGGIVVVLYIIFYVVVFGAALATNNT